MFNDEAILKHFPNFDYRHAPEPWLVDATQKNSIADLQIQAFHYYWTLEASKHGKIGLSLITPNLPFCFTLSMLDDPAVHRRDQIGSTAWLFQPHTFSCIVASAPLPSLHCSFFESTSTRTERKRAQCKGKEVVDVLHQWTRFLIPGGIMIAALLDNQAAMTFRNTNLIDEVDYQHAWSVAAFRRDVIEPFLLTSPALELVEYDTFRNNLAFNFVVRNK